MFMLIRSNHGQTCIKTVKMAKAVVCDLLQIFKSSVTAVLPENLIRNNLKYNPITEQLTVCGDKHNLKNKNIYLVGTGKAVRNMAIEVENILSPKLRKGIVSVPEGSAKVKSKTVAYCQGANNNLPDKNAENTTRKIYDLITSLQKDDLLLVLISGGGSALLSLPKPPVTLDEKIWLIKKLGNSGADIKELNTVRKQLSDIKAGKLAIKAQPAEVITLILSDIVGDPVDLLASGPTVENKDDPSKALDIIHKYNIYEELPNSIKSVLGGPINTVSFPSNNVKNHIIGSNKISLKMATEEASKLNYIPVALSNSVTGNIKDVAQQYAKLTEAFCEFLQEKSNFGALKCCVPFLHPQLNFDSFPTNNFRNKDICLLLGGEITVEVKGTGKGGRNQQLALEFSNNIHKIKDRLKEFDIYFLSAGTDGIDGPTDAAGAIGYKDLITDAKEENLDPLKYLENNDSYNFYKQFKNGILHVITGHTNTNVMDIHLILIRRI